MEPVSAGCAKSGAGSPAGGVAIGVALWGLHMGFTQGLFAALVADAAPAELRGTAFGYFNLLTGVAMLAASVIAGALWDAYGPPGTFFAGLVFALVALFGLLTMNGEISSAAAEWAGISESRESHGKVPERGSWKRRPKKRGDSAGEGDQPNTSGISRKSTACLFPARRLPDIDISADRTGERGQEHAGPSPACSLFSGRLAVV